MPSPTFRHPLASVAGSWVVVGCIHIRSERWNDDSDGVWEHGSHAVSLSSLCGTSRNDAVGNNHPHVGAGLTVCLDPMRALCCPGVPLRRHFCDGQGPRDLRGVERHGRELGGQSEGAAGGTGWYHPPPSPCRLCSRRDRYWLAKCTSLRSVVAVQGCLQCCHQRARCRLLGGVQQFWIACSWLQRRERFLTRLLRVCLSMCGRRACATMPCTVTIA